MSIYHYILYAHQTLYSLALLDSPPTEHSCRSAEISLDMCEGGKEDRGFGRSDSVEGSIIAYRGGKQCVVMDFKNAWTDAFEANFMNIFHFYRLFVK